MCVLSRVVAGQVFVRIHLDAFAASHHHHSYYVETQEKKKRSDRFVVVADASCVTVWTQKMHSIVPVSCLLCLVDVPQNNTSCEITKVLWIEIKNCTHRTNWHTHTLVYSLTCCQVIKWQVRRRRRRRRRHQNWKKRNNSIQMRKLCARLLFFVAAAAAFVCLSCEMVR